MVYIKDLGRVKGDKGNIYQPSVQVKENGKIAFTWVETKDNDMRDEQTQQLETEIDFPIMLPSVNNDGYISFSLTNVSAVQNGGEITPQCIKGDDGNPGEMKLRTEHVNDDSLFFEDMRNVDYEYFITDNAESSFRVDSIGHKVKINGDDVREDTLYITSDNYVYVINIEHDINNNPISYTATKLEGINLSKYYTKEETYSRSEIQQKFEINNLYLQYILGLLDSETPNYIDETINYYTKDEIDNMLDVLRERLYDSSDVTLNIEWEDDANAYNARPIEIECTCNSDLVSNNVIIADYTGWSSTLSLPNVVNNVSQIYSWVVPDILGYEKEIVSINNNITTIQFTANFSIMNVAIIWDDHDNATNGRPNEMEFVCSSEDYTRNITVSAETNWEGHVVVPNVVNGVSQTYYWNNEHEILGYRRSNVEVNDDTTTFTYHFGAPPQPNVPTE